VEKSLKPKQQILKAIFHIVGVAMIANGIWMVSRAIEWFFHVPADMLATGEPNGHLIRDVGFAYIVFGFALNWCAVQLQSRRAVFLMVSFFMVAHALGHVVEILVGLLPASHWWIDFPLVLFPGLVLGVLAIPRVWASLVGAVDAGDEMDALT
jgi:hypothetical protein